MPFRSKAQERWMFANKPQMAKEWASKTPNIKSLPTRLNPMQGTKTHKHPSYKK